jgi:hypothetical protein
VRTSDPGAHGSSVAARLLAVTNELRELDQSIESADLDSRVLRDFRGAVGNVCTTTGAAQQWIERRERGGDPYGVLPGLSVERVRRTSELARDLVLDLQAVEVDIETEGLRGLFEAIEGLHKHLALLFKN